MLTCRGSTSKRQKGPYIALVERPFAMEMVRTFRGGLPCARGIGFLRVRNKNRCTQILYHNCTCCRICFFSVQLRFFSFFEQRLSSRLRDFEKGRLKVIFT